MSIDFEADTDDERPGSPADLEETAAALVAQSRAEGFALTGDGGLLSGLIGRVLQGSLDIEMTEHLGYAPHAVEGRGSGNSRNGHYSEVCFENDGLIWPHLRGVAMV